MKNNILLCGFNGKNNTSKLLLDQWVDTPKLYLQNSMITSINQLYRKLKQNNFQEIFLFGQKLNSESIEIEIRGIIEKKIYNTSYDYSKFENYFAKKQYPVQISIDAGNYLCNHIYYHCLKYIEENKLESKAIFIHIPNRMTQDEIETFADDLKNFLL